MFYSRNSDKIGTLVYDRMAYDFSPGFDIALGDERTGFAVKSQMLSIYEAAIIYGSG